MKKLLYFTLTLHFSLLLPILPGESWGEVKAQTGNTWAQKADFGGTARYGAIGFSIDTNGYVGLGYDGTTYYQDFWEYNPSTDTWTQKANFGGTARHGAVGFVIDAKGYIGTGSDGTYKKDFWEWDKTTNTWTQKADFGGMARKDAVGFSIGDKGYIGTGWDGAPKNDFWEWNSQTDTWTQKANFGGTARHSATSFSISDKGYIGTGYDGTNKNDFWEYDTTANIWTQKANFGGTARNHAASFSIGTKGYIGTGNNATTYYNDFWEWDSQTNTWLQKTNFGGSGREYAIGFSISTLGYIGSGWDNTTFYNDFWQYTPSCLSGTYTIGSGGDFTTIQQALDTLYANGVCGPVTFNIFTGLYQEQLTINEIPGASATNTIIFQSQSGNATDVTIYFGGSISTANYVILFDKADYITFENVKLYNSTTGTYSVTLNFRNKCENLSFNNCIIQGQSGSSTSTNRALAYSGGNNDTLNYLIFDSCTFTDGSFPLRFEGTNTAHSVGLSITNNTFNCYYNTYIKYFDNAFVDRNTFSWQSYGALELSYCDSAITITNNTIIADLDNAFGIYVNNSDGTPGGEGLIANNLIQTGIAAGSACRGINLTTSTYQKVYHNTVNIYNSNSSSAAIYMNNADSIWVKNNIFSNFKNGYALWAQSGSAISEFDYNNLYSPGNYLVYDETTSHNDLGEWQTASGFGTNSVQIHPSFPAYNNLNSQTAWLDGIGTLLTEVLTDFNGVTRPANPDLGAQEFTPASSSLPLAGTYTIGTTGNFTSFQMAIDSLTVLGISGSVTFDVLNGTYIEQITLLDVPGASAANTITFQSQSGDSTAVILTYSGTSTDNYIVHHYGSDYITFQKMSFTATDPTYGRIFLFFGYSHDNSIQNNVLNGIGIASSSATRQIIYCNDDRTDSLEISFNLFSNGSRGIQLAGVNTTDRTAGIRIRDNMLNDTYRNIYLSYATDFTIQRNQCTNFTNAGIGVYQCFTPYSITENKLSSNATTGQGLFVDATSGSFPDYGLVANNFIDIDNDNINIEGIHIISSTYVNVFYNSVRMTSKDDATYAFYNTGSGNGNIVVYDNIFANYGNGKAYYNSVTGSIPFSDYNVLYTCGSHFGYWQGTWYEDYASFVSASGLEANSVNANPGFTSGDLHCNSPFVDNAGAFQSSVPTDIDGDTRSTGSPDIGADEFTSTLSPMVGIYTIGSSGIYPTFDSAVYDLITRSISGNVIFDVQTGTYTEQFVLPEIAGANPADTIIFQAQSGNASDVILQFDGTSTDNYVVQLFGADYVTFQNMTVQTQSGGTYSRLFDFSGNSHNNNFINLVLNGKSTYTTSDNNAIFYGYNTEYFLMDSTAFQNNTINGGSYGFYLNNYYNGNFNARNINGVKIWGNTINSFWDGIYVRYFNAISITSNMVSDFDNIGIMLDDCSNDIVVYNNKLSSSLTAHGIELYRTDGTVGNQGLVANNFIQVGGTSTCYGIYLYQADYHKIYYNSINENSTYILSRALYAYQGGNLSVRNNILKSDTGYTIYASTSTAITFSDYNDLYSGGTNIAYWNGTAYTTLSAYQAASGKDANSISVDPVYLSTTDLHLGTPALTGLATPLTDVPDDIDGDIRNAIAPDIGADELVCSPASINVYASQVCLGDTTMFIDSSTSVQAGSWYYWDFDGNGTDDDSTWYDVDTIYYTHSTAGTFNAKVRIEQPAGCIDSLIFSVIVDTLPNPTITPAGPFCETDAATTLVVVTSGGTLSGAGVSGNTFDPATSGPGSHIVTYNITDGNGCSNSDTETIVVGLMPNLLATTSDTVLCAGSGDSTQLDVIITNATPQSCGLSASPCGTQADTATIGSGTGTLGTTSYPAPYGNYYWGAKHQVLYKASELNAMGYNGGKITSLGFNVGSLTGDSIYNNFEVKMGCSNAAFISTWDTTLVTVFPAQTDTIKLGWNEHVFATPYDWDGVSNIIVEVCFNNSGYTFNAGTYYSGTPFTSVVYYHVDNSTVCSSTSVTDTSSLRPDVRFMICTGAAPNAFNYSWSPAAGLSANNIANPMAQPIANTTYTITVSDTAGLCTATDSVSIAVAATLTLSNSITNVTCNSGNDGAVDLTVSGGTTPYTYNWSNGATTEDIGTLTAGTYIVTVTSNGFCQKVDTAVITEPAAISASISFTDVMCNGNCDGTISVDSVSGGTSPYAYVWNSGDSTAILTGLCAGTYTLTLTDAANCTELYTVIISEPTALTTSITGTNVSSCLTNDGAADLSVSGATSPYTYNWSNGSTIQDLSSIGGGDYFVTVTDANNCSTTDSVTISQPGGFSISLSSTDNSCNGTCDGSASISTSGGTAPFTYSWSDGGNSFSQSNLCAATYGVTVTDANSCFATGSITISEPPAIILTVTSTNANCPIDDGTSNVSVSGGFLPYAYQWSHGDTIPSVDSLAAGIYVITVTDSTGCEEFDIATISDVNGPVITINSTNEVSCNGGSDGAITISVSGGTTPYVYNWSNGATTDDIFNLAAGPYEIIITDNIGCDATQSIDVNQPNVLGATVSTTASSCGGADGTATVTATGGSGFYVYAWSSGGTSTTETGLASGVYTVTITDSNGCLETINAAISEAGGPTIAIDSTTTSDCVTGDFGGIYISVSGGASPYTYNWSNASTTQDLTGVADGTYDVTVTGSDNCNSTASEDVNAELPPTNDICLVTVDSTTGTNKVVWQKPAIGGIASYNIYRETTQSGVYQNVGSVLYDSLSTFTDTVANPLVRSWRYKIAAVDTCGNESNLSTSHKTIHLNINLGVGSTINLIWDNYQGFNFSTYVIYRYTVSTGWDSLTALPSNLNSYTDSPPTISSDLFYYVQAMPPSVCTATKSAENYNSSRSNISQKIGSEALTATTTTTDATIGNCDGTATVTAIGGQPPYQYQWDGNAGSQTTTLATGLCPGTYSVTVTDFLNGQTLVFATVNEQVGIGENDWLNSIQVYPNPNKGVFTLEMLNINHQTSNVECRILNMMGQEVKHLKLETIPGNYRKKLKTTIDVSEQSSGVYYLQILSDKGTIIRKIVIEGK